MRSISKTLVILQVRRERKRVYAEMRKALKNFFELKEEYKKLLDEEKELLGTFEKIEPEIPCLNNLDIIK